MNGILLLKRDKLKKIVYLDAGLPVYVKSNLLSETLGKILVRENLITEDQCEASLLRMRRTRQRQGRILVELGFLSNDKLRFGLYRQLLLRLFELFTWEYGEYLCKTESARPPTEVPLETDTAAIIFDGIKKHFPIGRLRRLLRNRLDANVVPAAGFPAGPYHIEFDALDERILATIDGDRSLRALLQDTSNQIRVYQVIYALKLFGLVRFRMPFEEEDTNVVPDDFPHGN